jgi:hypothetical protein
MDDDYGVLVDHLNQQFEFCLSIVLAQQQHSSDRQAGTDGTPKDCKQSANNVSYSCNECFTQ